MNKVIVPLLAVASVGLGAATVWQNQQISAERQRATALDKSLADIQAKAADLEKEAARLREMNGIFQSESEQLRKRLAERTSDKAPGGGATGDGVQTASLEKATEKKEGANFMQSMAKMFKDPEMKKAMRGQQAMGIRMMYGDLAKELGLTPDEASQVMEILTDRQTAMSEKGMEMMNGASGDEAKLAEAGKSINESREEYDSQLENILGKDKKAKLQEYERTLGDRMALNQVQQQFAAQGIALEDSQKQNLLKVMVEERLKTPTNPWDPAKPDVAGQINALKSDDFLNRMIDQQKQTNINVLNRAKAFLSPDQVNALQQSQEQYIQMQEFGMKMGRQMLNK
ncbi:hypothetical protein ACXR0O_09140 [Verrucomicrobiota bacterium sgz303538]